MARAWAQGVAHTGHAVLDDACGELCMDINSTRAPKAVESTCGRRAGGFERPLHRCSPMMTYDDAADYDDDDYDGDDGVCGK